MAPDAGADLSALKERLTRSGHRFDFVQAMSLLEAVCPEATPPGEAGPLEREALRIRSHPALGFPPGDVHSIAQLREKPQRFQVVLNFMGLTGVSSPLPGYFVEMIARRGEGSEPLADFLALFEHRLYSLFWRAWKKYRLDLAVDEISERRRTRFLLGLAGLSLPALGPKTGLDPLRVAGFAGLLGTVRPTAAGLRNLVSGYFGGRPVHVQEFVSRHFYVEGRPGLGGDGGPRSARLGENALVGDSVLDRSTLVRIVVGPLPLVDYLALLPGGDWALPLAELARVYLPAQFDYQIQLVLRHEEIPACRLGNPQARLGWLSWLGRPAGDGESAPMSAATFGAA